MENRFRRGDVRSQVDCIASDVVAGIPLRFVRRRIEVLLDKLLSPRQSVAPAHQEIIDRRVIVIVESNP